MVLLYLKNQLQLKDDATHISTRFELSDTMNFSNIIDFSESTINKHAVLNLDVCDRLAHKSTLEYSKF